jgi:hypothetical protein
MITTNPPITKIIAFKHDGLEDYYIVERADGSTSEVWNPLTAGCPFDVWNAFCVAELRKMTISNEAIHADLGIASRHNPEGAVS